MIQILHGVINPEENEDDNDVDDYDDDNDVDDYDDDNGEDISDGNGTNGDVKGSIASTNEYSDTSSYTNTTNQMPKEDTASATSLYDLSLSIEDGNKPQEKLNIDNQTQSDGGTVEKRDINSDGVQSEAQQTVGEEKHDVNRGTNQIPQTPNAEKCDVNSDGPQTPKEKRDINSDGVQLEAQQTVGEEKHPDTTPEPQEGDVNNELGGKQQTVIVGEKPDTIDVNCNTENKLGSVIEIVPQQ